MAIGATSYTSPYPTSPLVFAYSASLQEPPLSPSDDYLDSNLDQNHYRKGGKPAKARILGDKRTTVTKVINLADMPIKSRKGNASDGERERTSGWRSPTHKASTSSLSSASSSSAAAASSSIASGNTRNKSHKLSKRVHDNNRYEKPQMKTIIERRNSAQSLKLDLEGLDLGHGGLFNGGIESIAEGTVSSPRGQLPRESPNNTRPRNNTFGASTSPSIPPMEEQQQATSQGRRGEDSFLAHLRKCEDSNDDYDANFAKSIDTFGRKERQLRIMAGEAAMFSKIPTGMDKIGESSSSPCSSTSSEAISMIATVRSPWTQLVPIPSNPISTLDIPSIEEMGLHSIDVGSSEDWRGFMLSYPSDILSQIEMSQRNTQWSIARSTKRQRKWIVTPSRLAPSRTVVISDHVSTAKQGQDSANSEEMPQSSIASGGRYSLRFLQTGTGAPNITILLASPASHRLQASRNSLKEEEGGGTSTPIAESTISTSVLEEHIQNTSSIDNTADETMTRDGSDQWTTMRANSSRRGSKLGLTHHRSSSTIHATITPMINLESRRPSLGKSISHESIFRELAMETTKAIKEEDYYPRHTGPTETSISRMRNDDEIETLSSPAISKPTFTSNSFANYSMSSVPPTNDVESSPRYSEQFARGQPFPSMIDPYDTVEMIEPGSKSSSAARNGIDIEPTCMTPTRTESGYQGETISSSSHVSKGGTPKKDRRLSGWIRKKVGVNQGSSSSHHQPPLPPAWQQTGRLSPLGGSLLVSSRDVLSSRSRKHGRSNQTTSSASGRSSGYDGSRSGGSDYMHDFSFSSSSQRDYSHDIRSSHSNMTSSTASPVSSASSIYPEDALGQRHINNRLDMMNMANRPLAQVYSSQGEYVWPGVMSARGERRRSNSDDNMALMMEAAKRRHEALTRGDDGPLASGAAAAAISIPIRRNDLSSPNSQLEENDLTAAFSSSLPAQSILKSFNDGLPTNRSSLAQRTPSALLDLDSVPSDALTMMIPLPLNTQGNKRGALRYLRVSYIPFGLNQEDIESSVKEGGLESVVVGHHHSSSSAWYKKIARTWNANAKMDSSQVSQQSNNQIEDEGEDQTYNNIVVSKYRNNSNSSPFPVALHSSTSEYNQAGYNRSSLASSLANLESFKIIAKVLTQPHHHHRSDTKSKETTEGLPEPFPFPFILGVCDRKKNVNLIAEGWQSIGLPMGPTEQGPMSRVADLIMAGCVACMDL